MAKGAKGTTARPDRDETQDPPQDPLAAYRKKRDFSVTPEPLPSSSPVDAEKEKKAEGLEFVVQKHDATRLHYDLRLEIHGAMASWAVPKGPSYDPQVKRLAVETEDHPMEYNRFEGRIPNGSYGAGDVLLWDRGTYTTVPPGQEETMRAKGHIAFRLFGEKLSGEWHLIKTHRKGDGEGDASARQWLLFKAKDTFADPAKDIVTERPESVTSGRSATRGPRRVGASMAGKSASGLLDSVGEPMRATLAPQLHQPDSYLYEIKYDGYRLLAGRAGSEVRLWTRTGNDWTSRFQVIADAIAKLDVRECVLDGEACIVDPNGRPSFADLQAWLAGERVAGKLAFAVFDLLWLDGRDVRPLPIEERKELLAPLLAHAEPPLSLSRAVAGSLAQIASVARASGLEGLVAKKKGSAYVAGGSSAWIKIKFDRRQDCAIIGYIPLSGTKDEVGALLLGVVDPDGALHYAGRVGTGFDARTRKELARLIDPDVIKAPAVSDAPRTKDARWSTPKLVCEIRFANWTRDHSARAPSFLGLREDKRPMECVREEEKLDLVPTRAPPHAGSRPSSVKLSNPDKVLYPRDGITKRQVFDYYTQIASFMLPHLSGRPLTLQRWPDGIDGEEWYQQNAPPKVPAFVRLVDVGEKHGNKKRIVADTLETLQWLANLASLTIHQWASHIPPDVTGKEAGVAALGEPDYSILDLDPGDGPFSHLVAVANAIHTLLEGIDMPSAIKTSGKRGVHIVVPLSHASRGATHDEATAFAEKIARAVAKVLPDISTVERMKAKREGKLYIDYLQNGEGRTIVAPYTLRALDGAPVSTPLAWDEVNDELDPRAFTMPVVLERVSRRGDLFAAALGPGKPIPRLG